ncbi:hypothetical protein OZ411_05530 [Bradyrhizobium sp. Arg237L]|jgi:hypothetical protein|nr:MULTISPECIES: hypothetical protein [unclassified Bradyrhizobium]MDI4232276.1 hypothetical protein [Bradyrhizobium sp. Arg237L]RZN30552.1 hypothetical protein CWO90_19980 [Bradyrhizobium sp. Leo121]TAI64549.1 hypothetical protein CWO89_18275 [Bradyrhizobium sp. Leo170]
MQHQGIEFTVEKTRQRHVWRWVFWIGDQARTGLMRTPLEALAIRRTQTLIDRELKKRAQENAC